MVDLHFDLLSHVSGPGRMPGVPQAEEQDPTTSASALAFAITQGV
jgi:hypothetical protein